MKTDFATCRLQIGPLDRAASFNETEVADLWLAINALVPNATGTYAEAASDTFPADLAGVLVDPRVGGVALACLLRSYAEAFHAGETYTDGFVEAARFLSERQTGPDLRRAARKGWAYFRARVDDATPIVTGLGQDYGEAMPALQRIPDESEKLAMLKRIADLAGRMFKSIRGAKSRKVVGVSGEYHGVERSSAIERMTGSQMGALADDVTEMLVWEAYTRRGLQTFRVRGPALEGRGPLVIAIDESSSMDGARNIWAKAAAVALVRSAHADNRPVSIIHWSTSAVAQDIRPGDAAGVIDAMLSFARGGTDTARALRVSRAAVQRLAERGHKGADLILVTDGEDVEWAAKQRAMDELRADGTRVFTIGIEIAVKEADPIRKDATYVALDRNAMTDPTSLNAVVGAL